MVGVTALRIFLGMCWISVKRQQIQACIFGSQPGCFFPCNCASDDVCDETTGACPGRCRQGQPRPAGNEALFDWRGPGCRIGNIAYKKAATQKGQYWDPNNAVDGLLPPPQDTHCAHTALGGGNAWWMVDLDGLYSIDNITVFNRGPAGERTGYFNIRVGNNSNFTNNALCVYYEGPVPNGGNVTLSCTSGLVGRYVSMERTGVGTDPNIISICEMVVMGHESVQTDCVRCVSSCDDIVGCRECSGFKPPHCTTPCEAGRYGINCESSCSEHHCEGGSTMCNNMNGGCPNGCQDWYLGDQCITHIKESSLNHQTAISGAAVSSSQIRVTWEGDDDVIANLSQYYGYLVQYKTNTDPDFLSGPNVSHVAGEAGYSAIIRELIHNTVYTLRVSVYRQQGDLYQVPPWPTRGVMVKTSCRVPDQVTQMNITISVVVNVEWQSAPSGCDTISSIHVLYRRKGAEEWMTQDVMDPTTSTSVSIADVTGGQWEVKVRVFNNENMSSDSMSETFTIPGNPPTATETTQNKELPDCSCSTSERLTISFGVLFGISALVNLGIISSCIWGKISKEQSKLPPKTFEESPDAGTTSYNPTGHYEELVGPMSTAPEGPYDELHMDEIRAPVEREYEQM